jgi:hypothetical protein
MKREYLKELGLEDEIIDKVLAENGKDIEREKGKAEAAKADAEAAKADAENLKTQLADRDKDLEELKKNAGSADEIKAQMDELKAKYDKDTEAYKSQIAERDYSAAASAAITGANVKFSSKGAERAFRDELKAKGLTLKDGALEGFDDFLKAQREADPGAFASHKPTPSFGRPVGAGGKDNGTENIGIALAKSIGAATAQNNKTYSDVLSQYKGE